MIHNLTASYWVRKKLLFPKYTSECSVNSKKQLLSYDWQLLSEN